MTIINFIKKEIIKYYNKNGDRDNMSQKFRIDGPIDLFEDLEVVSSDIEASAITSMEGSIVAPVFTRNEEDVRVAALSEATLALGERTTHELACGELSDTNVKDGSCFVVLMASRENALLPAPAKTDVHLESAILDRKQTFEK